MGTDSTPSGSCQMLRGRRRLPLTEKASPLWASTASFAAKHSSRCVVSLESLPSASETAFCPSRAACFISGVTSARFTSEGMADLVASSLAAATAA